MPSRDRAKGTLSCDEKPPTEALFRRGLTACGGRTRSRLAFNSSNVEGEHSKEYCLLVCEDLPALDSEVFDPLIALELDEA